MLIFNNQIIEWIVQVVHYVIKDYNVSIILNLKVFHIHHRLINLLILPIKFQILQILFIKIFILI